MTLNSNVIANISVDSPPVAGVNFGTPALAANPGSLGVGFTERVRFYSSQSAVDTDETAGDIDATVAAALTAAFSQPRRSNQVAVIRLDAGANPMQVTFTLAAGPAVLGDTVTIRIDDVTEVWESLAGGETATTAAGDLRAALTASLAGYPVVVSGAGADVIITASTVDDLFSYYSTYSGAITISFVVDEAGLDIDTALNDAISTPTLAAWYGFTLQSRADNHQETASVWAESHRPRLFMPQLSSEGIIDAVDTTDVASVIKANSRRASTVLYKSTDDEWTALSMMAYKLEADPNSKTTTWAHLNISGSTADVLTDTQLNAALDKYAAVYADEYGRAVFFEGKMGDGQFIDVLISGDWYKDRLQRDIADLLQRVSARNEKVPFTDSGIAQITGIIQRVSEIGVAAGHFNTFVISAPLASQVDPADKAARLLRVEVTAELTGAIHKVIVNGYLVIEI